VDATYRTIADRDHRAMAGALHGRDADVPHHASTTSTFLVHRRLQRCDAASRSATRSSIRRRPTGGAFADAAAFAKKVRVLWLGVGTVEPERMRDGHP
jgi:enterochelin esterase family protein